VKLSLPSLVSTTKGDIPARAVADRLESTLRERLGQDDRSANRARTFSSTRHRLSRLGFLQRGHGQRSRARHGLVERLHRSFQRFGQFQIVLPPVVDFPVVVRADVVARGFLVPVPRVAVL
jgi:hypothetical protein